MKIASFDPSINHPGWAILLYGDTDTKVIVDSGVMKLYSKMGNDRYIYIYQKIVEILDVDNIALALIELPTFENSARGKELIHNQGLNKLCMAAAVILAAVISKRIPFALITARQWKRSCPKPQILSRVEELFPEKANNWAREDEYEAVGLNLWGKKNYGTYPVFRDYGADNVED